MPASDLFGKRDHKPFALMIDSIEKIRPGDKILINGTIGNHGMTIMSQREDINFQSDLKSDCVSLAESVKNVG